MPGILLLAHGGPSSLDEVPAFLEQIRDGRPCSEELVDSVRERYRFIGGGSPLTDITRSAAGKLEKACGLPVYVGMLHWHPFLQDTIAQMALDGISRALAIRLVPHFSSFSVGKYRCQTDSAASRQGLVFDFVDSWHTSTPFIEGLADSIADSRRELRSGSEDQVYVIFSAHSLPKTALAPGDPYEPQLRETADRVAERLGLPEESWTIAYQSVSGDPDRWLGPSIEEMMSKLSDQGIHQVVVCPFGFVADQVEILYDLDVVAKQNAQDLGINLVRTPLLNDGSALVESLKLLIDQWNA